MENTFGINVLSGFYVVDCSNNEILVVPENVGEDVFIFVRHSVFPCNRVDAGVHFLGYFARSLCLAASNMLSSEEELSVQV